MSRIRAGGRRRQLLRAGAPDAALTSNAGLAAISELCDRLDVTGALDAAVGPVKQRHRGFGAGELLAGIAAAQLAGEDFLAGLDRQRADAAGQQLTPVPGLAATTAAGLARRVTPAQWQAVETGLAAVTGRMMALLPAPRAAALAEGPVTIDLDTTDVEVYGRKKRGVAYNHQGQRVGRPYVASWAETEIVLAADLGDGTDDPRATAPDLLRRALASLPGRVRASGRVAVRADAGYFAGQVARAAHDAKISFAIGAKRIAPLWRLLAGIAEDNWHDAIDMDGAQVAVAEYCPDWWPADTRLLVRRVLLDPALVSADPRSRRRRTLLPVQRANIFRDSKLGAALRHLPSGYPQVNLAETFRGKAAADPGLVIRAGPAWRGMCQAAGGFLVRSAVKPDLAVSRLKWQPSVGMMRGYERDGTHPGRVEQRARRRRAGCRMGGGVSR